MEKVKSILLILQRNQVTLLLREAGVNLKTNSSPALLSIEKGVGKVVEESKKASYKTLQRNTNSHSIGREGARG
ncbi:MAG TPA: hypothetical protein VF941_08390 [Clostridia bacterium]